MGPDLILARSNEIITTGAGVLISQSVGTFDTNEKAAGLGVSHPEHWSEISARLIRIPSPFGCWG